MWAELEKDVAARGYESVRMWPREVRRTLHMRFTDNVIIPEGMLARAAQRALLEDGVNVSIESHGCR